MTMPATAPVRTRRAVHLSDFLDICGRAGVSPVATAGPADVTCKRCLSILRYREQERRSFFGAPYWAALKAEIQRDRATYYEQACDHSELTGHEQQEERAFGRVEAYDDLLKAMERMEAGQ